MVFPRRRWAAPECSGLKDDRLRLASAAPPSMTLPGLVQHMALVERNWFQRVFAGQDIRAVFEEYARHNGHADSIRERIDGVAGV
nr:DUF664 domain-containing protein [Streptomyces sp. V3I8]